MMMSESEVEVRKVTTMCLLSSLPDELALNCIARLSTSDYAALSLVSKKYRSLVVSPDLYKMRSLMGRTEKRLYVCLRNYFYSNSTLNWFILSREKAMIPIPLLPSQPAAGCSLVSLDWGIYAIGGWKPYKFLSDVKLLDCRTHTWRRLPSMRVARTSPAAGVVNGKIYVIGGCKSNDNSLCWGEVFDLKTQTWDNLVPLPDRTKDDSVLSSVVTDDKVYTVSERGIVYYWPNESRWVRVKETNNVSKPGQIVSYCFGTGKLLYCCNHYGNVFWSELDDEMEWKEVKGLEALHGSLWSGYYHKLINIGKNIMLISYIDGYMERRYDWDFWCSEISFKRSKDKNEVWGTIEWSQAVASNSNLGDNIVAESSAFLNL